MDGLSYLPATQQAFVSRPSGQQRTLKSSIGCGGVGLHSGQAVQVRLLPAAEGTGIVFHRTDLDVRIPARFDHVVDTRLCTVLGAGGARVGTVEHLMAALAACGVDNAVVAIDGEEIPVLDGSSEPWVFLIDCAGTVAQDAPRRTIEVLRTVRVEQDGAWAELRPGVGGFELSVSIDFAAGAIGQQSHRLWLDEQGFRRELARARTFAQRHEIEGLQRAGLARGGSLENAVVVDGDSVLNPAGLRMPDEFVRHKLLDAVGDLALAGAPLEGRFTGNRSGHALNNQVLRALFADAANWRFMDRAGVRLAA